MKTKFLLSTLVLLFSYSTTFGQTPTAIDLEIEGGQPTTICRGTTIQINATITPPNANYFYNWTNTTTGQNYNPWPVGQGGSGQGDDHSFLLLTDLDQSSTIQLQVNGVNQTIDIIVVDAPNPGTDGSLLLCNQTGTINLFDLLQGLPDAGGTWNPPLSGGGGNFVVGIDPPGAYIYTVNGNDPCPDAEAKVEVRECFDLDFDNDGVPNDIDLDDDNDGILDAVENSICTDATLSETRPLVDIDFGQGNVATTDPNVLGHNRSPIWPNDGFYNVGTSTFFGNSDNFLPTFVMTNANPIPNSDGSGDVNGRYLAINVNNGANQPIYRVENIPIQLDSEYNFRIDIAGLCDQGCTNVPMLDLELIDQNLPAGSPPIFATTSAALGVANDDIWRTLLLNFTADRTTFLTLLITNQQPQGSNGNDLGIDNIRFAQLECDFDLDEIPNYLDLDSDNDGIFDIVEAGNPAVIDANNDGIADGPVGANGVPLSAGAGTTPVNSDGAEFADYLDIDADNDGIQDNIEGQGTFTYIAPSGNDSDRNGVDDVYDAANNPVTPADTDGDNTPDYLDLNSDDDCLNDNVEAYDLNQDGVADILPVGTDTDGDGLDDNYDTIQLIPANAVTNPSDGNEIPTALPDNHNPGDDVDFRDEFEEILEEIELDFCSGLTTPINLFDNLVIMAIPGGTWTGPSVLTGGELGTFDPTTNAAGIYTYTLPIIGNCPERKAEVTITLGANPDTGTDGVATLCETSGAIDLFDSLGGTPNVGGEWSPPLASGTGVFDPAVDTEGTYTYTIAFPDCPSSSTNVVVTINPAPEAGENGSLEICESSDPIDLFTILQGTPNVGGTWTPNLASGTSVFDPSVDLGGVYTYTVAGVAPCMEDTAQVEVNLIANPEAGLDGSITLCDNSDSIDLFTLLGGTPDTGGTWTPNPASGTGVFNPTIDIAGTYIYTVSAVGCEDDTSEIVVTINSIPDAGEDGNLEICESGTTLDLFTLIQGTPDVGGTWTPMLSSGTGVFNPAVDLGGTYTYTVTGINPCPDDSSQITVNLIDVPDAGIDSAITLCNNEDPVDLFTLLGGTPDTGGEWTPTLTSGTGIFDPATDTAGIYTYTVSVIGCENDTSEVLVGVNITPNAGTDGNLDICETNNPVDLFTTLGGNPDASGVWSPVLNSGTGIFDPTIDTAGIYTYTINGPANCPDDSAQVIVNVINVPDPGLDGAVTLCNNNDAIDLFDNLGGTPDLGGTWTPPLASGTSIFDPSIDPAGPYTYTVTASSCGEASSQATVTVNPAVNAGENSNLSTCDSGNSVNLFDLLGGTPDIGGIWTPALASGTNIFDPTVDNPGTYTYTVTANAPCTDDTSEVIVTFDNTLTVIQPGNLRQCDIDNDSVEAFNLEQQTALITADNLDYAVTYHVSQPDADNGLNPLNSPYNNIANPQTIYTRVREMSTGCIDTSINFNIELEDIVLANPDIYELCDDNMEFDGNPTNDSTLFDLISRNAFVLGPTQMPINFSVTYHLTQEDANSAVNELISPYENTTNTQTIFARVENNTTSCFATSEVILQVNPMPSFTIEDSYTICVDPNGTQVIPPPIINTGLTTVNYSFEWYLNGVLIAGETNGSITPVQIGDYTVIVTNTNTGCVSTGINTVVMESAPPVLTAQQISLTFVEDNTILATATNGGNVTTFYEFRLDDGPWVANTPNDNTYTFENVSAGEHVVTARDLNGCGESSVTLFIIDYIPYFTPNSDGINDTWQIVGAESIPDAKIYIFNRFGKLLKELSPLGIGWDGTYNNEILPTSDYWFTINYKEPNTDERKTFKSHFTLKR